MDEEIIMMQLKILNEILIVGTGLSMLGLIGLANLTVMETQSKLAEVKSDFIALGTALDQYRIDWDGYPIYYPGYIINNNDGYGRERQLDFLTLPWTFSTPIAYLSEYPTDPFKKGAVSPTGLFGDLPYESGNTLDEGYIWLEMDYARRLGIPVTPYWQAGFDLWGEYRLSSIGPAQKYPGFTGFPVSYNSIDSFYDPSNGLMSLGMVTLTQIEGSKSRDRWVILGEPIDIETLFN